MNASPVVVPDFLVARATRQGRPRVATCTLARGQIKVEPEDFVVEEIPAYTPCGDGDFAFLWLEKRDRAWGDVRAELCRALRLPDGELGVGGIKDRRAVTRQYVSVPWRAIDAPAARAALDDIAGVRVLRVERHTNKLRTGHLRGNRFHIRVAQLQGVSDSWFAALESVATGVPNYYGDQRFGHGQSTLEMGWRTLQTGSKPRDRFRAKLAISAAQSALFNDILARRVESGTLFRALAGDVMTKATSGGLFVCEEPSVDQARLDAGELIPTGPIYGRKTFAAAADVARDEAELLDRSGLPANAFDRLGKLAMGTRRPLFVRPEDWAVERGRDEMWLQFALPSGAYATVVLDEFLEAQ